jgi:hypothetical protein
MTYLLGCRSNKAQSHFLPLWIVGVHIMPPFSESDSMLIQNVCSYLSNYTVPQSIRPRWWDQLPISSGSKKLKTLVANFMWYLLLQKVLSKKRKGRDESGRVGVKWEIRTNITIFCGISTCSLVVMNWRFGGIWFFHMRRRRLKIKAGGFFETSEPACQTTHCHHISEHPHGYTQCHESLLSLKVQ